MNAIKPRIIVATSSKGKWFSLDFLLAWKRKGQFFEMSWRDVASLKE